MTLQRYPFLPWLGPPRSWLSTGPSLNLRWPTCSGQCRPHGWWPWTWPRPCQFRRLQPLRRGSWASKATTGEEPAAKKHEVTLQGKNNPASALYVGRNETFLDQKRPIESPWWGPASSLRKSSPSSTPRPVSLATCVLRHLPLILGDLHLVDLA